MEIVPLTSGNFEAEVLDSRVPVLVDFWAPWCVPCRTLNPIVVSIANGLAGRLKVGQVNVDEYGNLATRYGVMSVPTLILFKEGEPVERIVGVVPGDELLNRINAILAEYEYIGAEKA
ncbi:MAG TPA: thioredoxin [Firmicutes bacterium]|nr:thioredoxin [Bacillota bacterium]